MNGYLPLFHRSDASMKMVPEELNVILLHDIPNGWSKKAYIKSFDFE